MGWMDDIDDLPEDGPRFFKVCRLEQIPTGSGRIAYASGTRVALFKADGQIYAVQNLCPHAGASLGVGEFKGLVVTCPRHDWTFNVKTGACLNKRMYSLRTFPVEVRQGEVWVQSPG